MPSDNEFTWKWKWVTNNVIWIIFFIFFYEKFDKVRPLIAKLNKQCLLQYLPEQTVCIDESFIPYFGRIWLVGSLGWLAHLVSWFACNTKVLVDASSNPPLSNVKSLWQNLVSIHQVNKKTLHHQSISQMVIL